MPRSPAFVVSALVALTSLAVAAPVPIPSTAPPPPPTSSAPFALGAGIMVLSPISHAGLTIFPVVVDKPQDDRDYVVLDEGMMAGTIKVIEKDGGEVNQLEMRNTSDKPAFLMAGEVVIGGKQDRIIGKNMVIEPHSKESIPVFCVEHGRWNGRKAEFSSANALAHKQLRTKASFGSQGEVWEEVSAKNAKRAETNDTDTYRRVATGAKVAASLESYQRAFASLARADGASAAQRVGYVVALDGKVVAIEVFGSPKLFAKLEPKLRKSYFVEAIDATTVEGAKLPPPSAEAVQAFDRAAKSKPRKTVVDKPSSTTTQFDEGALKGSKVERKDGKPVYDGAYAE